MLVAWTRRCCTETGCICTIITCQTKLIIYLGHQYFISSSITSIIVTIKLGNVSTTKRLLVCKTRTWDEIHISGSTNIGTCILERSASIKTKQICNRSSIQYNTNHISIGMLTCKRNTLPSSKGCTVKVDRYQSKHHYRSWWTIYSTIEYASCIESWIDKALKISRH